MKKFLALAEQAEFSEADDKKFLKKVLKDGYDIQTKQEKND